MLTGAPLTLGEFRYLLANPVFAHLAERLLWRTMEGQTILWAAPERWETLAGDTVALEDRQSATPLTLTLVHPVELEGEGVLGRWQSVAADRRLMQPFNSFFARSISRTARKAHIAGALPDAPLPSSRPMRCCARRALPRATGRREGNGRTG